MKPETLRGWVERVEVDAGAVDYPEDPERLLSRSLRRAPGIADLFVKFARRWSQAQPAEALGVAVQQVQRYEATGYTSASLARLADVARVLGIDVSETATLRRSA